MINSINRSHPAFQPTVNRQAANNPRNHEFSVFKKENDTKEQCATHKLPGAEALTVVSDLPRYIWDNAIDIYKYRDNYSEMPEQVYNSTGIRYLGAVRLEHEFAYVSEADMIEVLNDLRTRFRIPITVAPSNGEEFLKGEIWSQHNVNSPHILTISSDGLRQMASNPDMHLRFTENIQKWIDASSDLVKKNRDSSCVFKYVYWRKPCPYWVRQQASY